MPAHGSIIITAGLEAATNTDILQGGRLQTVPSNGILQFELQAADAVAANNYTVSVQLPSGATPLNAVVIPGNSGTAGVAGIINERDALKMRFRIGQGGHCVFSCIETGDTELAWRVSFFPR